jgi:RNA polymerase sigma-70 factor (ECF subfamily)
VIQKEGQRTRLPGRLSEWDLENLVQETFTRAYSEGARLAFDGVRPYGAYLCTIARNLLIDRARKQHREAKTILFVEDIEAHGVPKGFEEKTDPGRRQEMQELKNLIDVFEGGLNSEDARLFDARYRRGLSLRRSAKALGVSLFKVRRLDARIRSRLLDALQSAGYLEHARVRIGKSVLRRHLARAPSSSKPGERP